MVAFDMTMTVMAFHYALLAMSVGIPKVRTGHPKLLIIDEPEQQKMGKTRYLQVLELFSHLGIEYKDQVQVVIATETKDIPANLDQYSIEI
jgi:ABC-type antimicrobial peptide transport system ATPase subunit